MAIADNPFGGGPFGDGPFGPKPGALTQGPIGWYRPFERAARRGARFFIVSALIAPLAPAAAPDNTVTIDKWQQPLNRSVPVPVAHQGHHLFVPAEATVDNTTVKVWPLTQGEIARPIARVAAQGHHLFVPKEATLENTTVRVWPLTQGLKAAPIDRVAQQGHHLFVPKEATLENTTNVVWPLVVRDEKAHPIPRVAPQGQLVFGYPQEAEDNTRVEWDWCKPFPDRAPQTFAKQGHHLFVPDEATSRNTDVKVWPLTQGEIARPIQRPAPQGAWVFGYPYEGVDNTRTEWDWTIQWPDRFPQTFWKAKPYQPFVPKEATVENTTNVVWPLTQGEVARPIPATAPQGQHLFVPAEATSENTSVRVWPLTQGEKARPIARVAPQGAWAFGYPYEAVENTRTEWDWAIQWPDRMPRFWWKGRPYQPFVPREATRENTTNVVWPLTQGEVARPIPRIAPLGQWAFGYPYEIEENTRTEWDWYKPFPDRAPRFWWRGRPYQPFVPREATVENTITGIAWLEAWRGPPRYWPGKTNVTYQPIPRIAVVHTQSIECELVLTVDFHICGWGTEAQTDDGFAAEAETGDAWSGQDVQIDVWSEQTAEADASDEQAESSDEYEEKDECGRG